MQANPQIARLRTLLDMTMRQAGLGARLQEARLARGLKQKDVAAAVHVEPVTVSRWERGATTPDLVMLERLADVYGVPVAAFVRGAEPATALPSEAQQEILARLEAVFDRLGRVEAELAHLRGSQPAPPERRAV